MSDDIGRYELKYVLNECHYTSSMLWLDKTTVRQVYPDRFVNSLYFDDINYQSVHDNLAGVSDRKKIRLRWYHDNELEIKSEPKLEIKIRKGRLGLKDHFELAKLKNNIFHVEIRDIVENIKKNLRQQDEHIILSDAHYIPSLYVSYKREYYEDWNGLRITIDKDIKFHHPHPYNKLTQINSVNYPSYIMELKFPIEIKDEVGNTIKDLNLRPRRHSKYLVGLAILGNTQYI